jgi:hypothetical protein
MVAELDELVGGRVADSVAAELCDKIGRYPMIAKPDELIEREPVARGSEGGDEIGRDSVVAKPNHLLRGEVADSEPGELRDVVGGHPMIAHAAQRRERADPVAVPAHALQISEVGAVIAGADEVGDGPRRIALPLELVEIGIADVVKREREKLALAGAAMASPGERGGEGRIGLEAAVAGAAPPPDHALAGDRAGVALETKGDRNAAVGGELGGTEPGQAG